MLLLLRTLRLRLLLLLLLLLLWLRLLLWLLGRWLRDRRSYVLKKSVNLVRRRVTRQLCCWRGELLV